MLALRFLDGIPAKEIAQMFELHPSQITRTVKQAQVKFRHAALARLRVQHRLDEPAVKECVSQFLDGKLTETLCLSVCEFLAPDVYRARAACAV